MNDNIILFENYILNRMSADARIDFEKSLQEDATLSQSFEDFKRVMIGLARNERRQLLDQMKMLENAIAEGDTHVDLLIEAGLKRVERKKLAEAVSKLTQQSTPTKQRRINWMWRSVAASVAIIALAASGLYFMNQQQSNQLFDDYFTNYDHAFIKRSTSNDQIISQAYSYYDNQEYKKAIDLLETLEDNPMHKLYLGISYLGVKKSADAKRIFDELNQSLPSHRNVIYWYTALAELQQGDTTSMIDQLERIEYDRYWLERRDALLERVH